MSKRFTNILQVSKNVLLKVVVGALMLLFLVFWILQLDVVQTHIAQSLADYLSKKIEHRVEIGKISIRWFDDIHIEEVYVEDDRGREMIWVESCDIDYSLSSMFFGNMIVVDHFEVLRPRFGMVQYTDLKQLNINEMVDKIAQAFPSEDNEEDSTPTPFLLKSAHVTDGAFFYDDQRFDTLDNQRQFDESHFYLDSVYSGLTDLYIHYDTVQLKAIHLSTIDTKTKLMVNDLTTFFRMTDKSLEFYEIDGSIGNSYVSDKVVFRYEENVAVAFRDFSTKVKLEMDLKHTSLHTKDLAFFAPGIEYLDDYWRGTGILKGRVANFRSRNFLFEFGQRSHLRGKMEFDGLPDFFETIIDFDLKNSNVYPEDLEQYITAKDYYEELRKLGDIKFNSTFYGFPLNFSAIGDFETRLGTIHNDVTLKVQLDDDVSTYRGYIRTDQFDIGAYLENDYLGDVAVDGNVVGEGFSLENAILDLDAKVNYFEMNNYRYENIDVDGVLKDRFFTGHLDVKDSNLVMIADGEFNLKPNVEKVKLKAIVRKAYPKMLGFLADTSAITTTLDVDFKGFTLETIEGAGEFKNSSLYYDGNSLELEHFGFASRLNDTTRFMAVESNLISAFASGNFKFSDTYKGVKQLLYEMTLKAQNDEAEIEAYYIEKKNAEKGSGTDLDFRVDLKDAQPVLDLVFPSWEVSPKTQIKGSFKDVDTIYFHVDSRFDSLKYRGVTYKKNSFDIILSKGVFNNEVSASYFIGSDEQWSNNVPVTKGLMLGGYWDQEMLTFNSRLKTKNGKGGYNINGEIEFEVDTTKLKFFQCDFKLDSGHLTVPDTNLVLLKGGYVDFKKFELLDNLDGRRHYISGHLNGKEEEDMAVLSLSKFNLKYLSYFAGVDLGGAFTGDIKVNDFYGNTNIETSFEIEDFLLYEGNLGNYRGDISWSAANNKIKTDVGMFLDSLKLADIGGYVLTSDDEKSPLNLKFDLNNIPLTLIEPYMYGQVSAMEGNITGTIEVQGGLDAPDFYGEPNVVNGGFTIEYLKTHYVFNERILFKNDSIIFSDVNLADTLFYTNAKLNGVVTHKLFTDFIVDADIGLNKTLIQDTKKGDNELYYGRVFASGLVKMKGPYEELVLSTPEIKSEKGTHIIIPLDSEEGLTKADFIKFIDSDEIENKFDIQTAKDNVDITGITLLLNMNITEEALIDIVFDEKSGDKLSGRGKGLLLVDMNAEGSFNMYGNYEILKGNYTFSMLNLLNKSFDITEGSMIRWDGDPYKGTMDLEATYRVMTNVVPIITDTAFLNSHSDVKRPSPVDVSLGMTGNIMTPDIKFNIKLKEYPNYIEVEQAVLDFESRIKYNEQELNKQVFSLIILKKLSPLDDFNMNLSSTAGASVSEVFTSQLGYMLSQLNEDLDVYIDLGSFENDNQSINVRLTYSVLDGRLRISHNGNYSNYQQSQDFQNLFGEWTVEYLLSNDGKLRMKGYNKLNQNTTSTTLSDQNSTVYGVSVSYNDNFNSFAEFWDNFSNRFRRKEEEGEIGVKRKKSKRLENLGL